MKIKFWGVRGSIPAPGPKTVKYGGNTTCIEVRTDDNELIIFDGGTGIFPLAQSLFPELPISCHIFITHTHWDHIQGLPFFIPMFIPGNDITIYGTYDPVQRRSLGEVLSQQWTYSYYPVRSVELKSQPRYVTLQEYESVRIGCSTFVSNIYMNHPVLNFGYRVECNGKSIFFTGDHEYMYNIHEPEERNHDEFTDLIRKKNKNIKNFIQGVDVLIADTSYTDAEYPDKKGWGHGTYGGSVALAKAAGVKHLFFTHHEPTRNDEALERIYQETLERFPRTEGDPEYHLAREGLEFEL
ncbi:MBL fold metallo-hydrolase [Magnetococcales bacterium HHB-1]